MRVTRCCLVSLVLAAIGGSVEATACTGAYDEAIGHDAAQVLADLAAAPASYDAACGLPRVRSALGRAAGTVSKASVPAQL